jgi:hypothetical protein
MGKPNRNRRFRAIAQAILQTLAFKHLKPTRLGQLKKFENGQLKLDVLVDDLEGLLSSLEDIPNSWRQAFLSEWGKLEDERAYALSENLKAFDDETNQRLLFATARLKLLVLEKMDSPIGK